MTKTRTARLASNQARGSICFATQDNFFCYSSSTWELVTPESVAGVGVGANFHGIFLSE
jgi:hypothetical protein